jgi:hypothetical protein
VQYFVSTDNYRGEKVHAVSTCTSSTVFTSIPKQNTTSHLAVQYRERRVVLLYEKNKFRHTLIL